MKVNVELEPTEFDAYMKVFLEKQHLQLEQMKQDHDVAMKKIDIELSMMHHEHQIKLTEMTEIKREREENIESVRRTNLDTITMFSDLMAGVVAATKEGIKPRDSKTKEK